MQVRRIDLFLVETELKVRFETSFGAAKRRQAVIVRVEDAGGEVGWGESPADEGPWYSYETAETAFYIISRFLSKYAFQSESPKDFMRRSSRVRGHSMAKAGLEMALWDLESKLEGKPLWKHIGGVRDKIESGVSIGIASSIEELLKWVDGYLEKGYRRIKLKIKPGWDLDVVKAVRKEFGDVPLQVDANAAYKLEDWPHLKGLDKYDLLMLEQPLHYDDLIMHSMLARLIRTPICLDESIKDPRDVYSGYSIGSFHIVNVKPARVGGLANTIEINDFTQKVGVPIWIGGMLETGVGRGHLVAAATLSNVKFPNDVSASDRYYEEDVVEPPWELNSDGTISVPNKPGIGVEVLEDRIEAHSIKKATLKS